VEELLQRLCACSDVHFASEELLMRLHRYPRYGMHVEEHRRLLDQLGALGAGGDPRALVRVVETWIEEHVRGMDRDFVEHVTAGKGR
jgi:hemerythrin-like metal-binding protein